MRISKILYLLPLLAACNLEQPGTPNSRPDTVDQEYVRIVTGAPGKRDPAIARLKPMRTVAPASQKPAASRAAATQTTGPQLTVRGIVKYSDGSGPADRLSTATAELWTIAPREPGIDNPLKFHSRIAASRISRTGVFEVVAPDTVDLALSINADPRVSQVLPPPASLTTASLDRVLTVELAIPAPSRVTGRVIDSNNQPVTSASVSLVHDDLSQAKMDFSPSQTLTNSTGEFVLEGGAGRALIAAAAEGFPQVATEIDLPTSVPVLLRLTTATASVEGTLLRFPSDKPIANAKITARPAGVTARLGLPAVSTTATVTTADGRFHFASLPVGKIELKLNSADGQSLYLAPDRENSTAAHLSLQADETTAVTLRAFPGYEISGRVYDKDTSEPLSGAQLSVLSAFAKPRTATSAADGAYKLDHVDPRAMRAVQVKLEHYTLPTDTTTAPRSDALPVNFPEDTDKISRDIPMVATVMISGRVESEDGLPIPGAALKWVTSNHFDVDYSERTDENGDFQFQVSPFSTGLVEVKADGFGLERSESISVSSKDVDGIKIVLKAAAVVEGRVVNSQGAGVAGAIIQTTRLFPLNGAYVGIPQELAKTDQAGNFRTASLAAGKVTLAAESFDYPPAKITLELKPGETRSGVVIRLAGAFGVIEGRVLNDDNQPVAAQVYAQADSAETDAAGRFRLNRVPEGKVTLYAHSKRTYESRTVEVETGRKDVIIRLNENVLKVPCRVIDVSSKKPLSKVMLAVDAAAPHKSGPEFELEISRRRSKTVKISAEGYATKSFRIDADPQGEELRLLEMGSAGGVSGRVVNEEGKPLSGIPVTANPASDGTAVTNSVSDKDGKFLLSGIPGGSVDIMAIPSAPLSPARKSVDLESGKFQDIGDLVVPQLGSVSGRVVRGASAQPVAQAEVRLSATGAAVILVEKSVETADDGTFEFRDLPAGNYRVASESKIQTTEVQSGKVSNVVISLGSAGLQGRVLYAGKPAEAMIEVVDEKTGFKTMGFANRDTGKYEVENLIPGSYRVKITRKDYGTVVAEAVAFNLVVPDQSLITHDFVLPQ